ncbi:MAG: 4-hydroxy-tetrahydrodipicolinate reductase [Gammaproteobacteria bacterium]|nr:MAG: 4-hydroxy-tetrahydrodipicolinate reductase [Gammaproteobacteria bacterium]RTZ67744.1 MAG: 4-hydroxy-tetrahydrodipicolinate reductase [Aquificaceae bacterium]
MTVKVVVSGALGRMGRRIISLALQDPEITVCGALETEENVRRFNNLGDALNEESLKEVPLTVDAQEVLKNCDVLIEFSNSTEGALEHTQTAVNLGKKVVIGTTGFSKEQLQRLEELAKEGTVLFSPNMSLGVNLLFRLVQIATRVLKDKDFDIEIGEIHHRFKKDAPSGTAMKLAQIVAQELGVDLDKAGVFGRKGHYERAKNDIGIMTFRGGDVVGEHTVYFFGFGERLELTHRATNRDIFAKGALVAAKWIADKKPGKLYNMFDVLGL